MQRDEALPVDLPASYQGGELNARDLRVAIVAGGWHWPLAEQLIAGAESSYLSNGGERANLQVLIAPGSYELPVICKGLLSKAEPPAAIVCLGVLIRGETLHYELIAQEVSRGLGALSREFITPIGFGVLAVDRYELAAARVGGAAGNKGDESMTAAIQTANLLRKLAG